MEPALKQSPRAADAATRPVKRRVVRWVRLIGGWTLLGLGILGLFLPFLQGFLMMAGGLALLYKESPFIARQIDRLKPYYRLVKMHYSTWKNKRRKKT